MSETTAPDRGLIDTSIVIALDRVDPDSLPSEVGIAAITLAELAAGPHATDDSPDALAAKSACSAPKQLLMRSRLTPDALAPTGACTPRRSPADARPVAAAPSTC